jgi:hypothetical protein
VAPINFADRNSPRARLPKLSTSTITAIDSRDSGQNMSLVKLFPYLAQHFFALWASVLGVLFSIAALFKRTTTPELPIFVESSTTPAPVVHAQATPIHALPAFEQGMRYSSVSVILPCSHIIQINSECSTVPIHRLRFMGTDPEVHPHPRQIQGSGQECHKCSSPLC